MNLRKNKKEKKEHKTLKNVINGQTNEIQLTQEHSCPLDTIKSK